MAAWRVRVSAGDPNFRCIVGKNDHVLAQQNREEADAFARRMIPIIEEIKAEGNNSIRAIAAELNRRDIPTMKERVSTRIV